MIRKLLRYLSERRFLPMKKKVYTRPVSIVLSVEMFNQVKTIADNEEIGISDYVREAIREKLATFNQNNIQKGE